MRYVNTELNLTCETRQIETSLFDGLDWSEIAITRLLPECVNDIPQLMLDPANNQRDVSVTFTEGSLSPVRLYRDIFLQDIDSAVLILANISLVDGQQQNEGSILPVYQG